jgi:hypothetical protein
VEITITTEQIPSKVKNSKYDPIVDMVKNLQPGESLKVSNADDVETERNVNAIRSACKSRGITVSIRKAGTVLYIAEKKSAELQ